MTGALAAAVTAWAVHLPPPGLPGVPGCRAAEPADRAGELLGRRGLLSREPATRLALCAVHRALGLAPGDRGRPAVPDPGTAVVASSNLGNVASVCGVVRTLREGSVRDVSPLDAPNASSNIVASTVAIWFGFGGPNLMVCSGATSGLDAVVLGLLLLAGGRADRVVVVGSEPDDPIATALHARRAAAPGGRLRAGAAAVVLERPERAPGSPRLLAGGSPAAGGLVVGPAGRAAGRVVDVAREYGDTYGAHGVVQVAVAVALVAAGEPAATVICGDDVDGWRLAGVRREP